MNIDFLRQDLDRIRRSALAAGVALLVPAVIWGYFNPSQFFRSYLLAYMFWLGLSLGCLSVLMLQHLVQGRWGFIIQRQLEAGTRVLPLLALLILPLLFGVRHLYSWSLPEVVAASEKIQHKAWWLNVPFWVARAIIYLAIWNALAWLLSKWSREQDQTGNGLLINKLKRLSAPGLIIYGLTITYATVDWVMSLEPEWYSTIFGLIFIAGQALLAFSFCVLLTANIAVRRPGPSSARNAPLLRVAGIYKPEQFHDLGNLMLTFVMLWAYLAFSQLLIIWAGNLPEEILFFSRRLNDYWGVLAGFLILFHFFVPFMLLLMRPLKKNIRPLAGLAALLVFMRFVDLFWMIAPAFHPRFYIHLLDVMLPLGMGGLWIAAFARQVTMAPLFPVNDPRAAAVLK